MMPEDVPYQYEVNEAISLLSSLVDAIRDISFELKDIRKEIADISNQM